MQLRLSTLLWMFVVVVAAFGLYLVKYQVQSLKEQVADAEAKLAAERASLHVIEAEWTYLNRPERLQKLTAKYLREAPLLGDQISELEAVPFPAPSTESSLIAPASAVASHGGGDGE